MVPGDGGQPERYTVSPGAAALLLKEASRVAAEHGLPWEREPLTLKPAPKLAALIRESRRRAAAGETEESEASA
jgi:CRISPR-associated protein Csb1